MKRERINLSLTDAQIKCLRLVPDRAPMRALVDQSASFFAWRACHIADIFKARGWGLQ